MSAAVRARTRCGPTRYGWDVTALDLSKVALDRARSYAPPPALPFNGCTVGCWTGNCPKLGLTLSPRSTPALRRSAGDRAQRALMNAVAPGGALLVVGHDTSDRPAALKQAF